MWSDFRDESKHKIKANLDKSLSSRTLDTFLYHMYQEVRKFMEGNQLWEEGMRLGSTGNPRKIFLKYANKDTRTLFSASVLSDKKVELKPDESELLAIKMTPSMIEELYQKASEAMEAPRGRA